MAFGCSCRSPRWSPSSLGRLQRGAVFDPWRDARPMSVARAFDTASLRPNGRVLVAGGTRPSTTPGVASRPAPPSCTRPPRTRGGQRHDAHPRAFHSAVVLKSGRVLVVGGIGDGLLSLRSSTRRGRTSGRLRHPPSPAVGVTATRLFTVRRSSSGYISAAHPKTYTPWTNTWQGRASFNTTVSRGARGRPPHASSTAWSDPWRNR